MGLLLCKGSVLKYDRILPKSCNAHVIFNTWGLLHKIDSDYGLDPTYSQISDN